ncbi:DUF1203 domain-containing protein [Rhodophyticola sp. CCM32]|uniref:DUF1203 domain-containing protein n=1 Tax=Rhodophyticola sp. CCM32 TaxID=2916397 RepID=UPI00107F687B|nr:DUF1203 domain-containing protein [Rhodophyticola sp. CCM32]QBY00024.1 DUF1203 domain-containing protein [Rhodophyticola sp. CCM32]
MTIQFHALPTDLVTALRNGAPDANGQVAERKISTGAGMPCRHCLCEVPEGADALVLNLRPFRALHPYAESGPVFLCAGACKRGGGDDRLPEIFTASPDYLVKAYDADERIIYGTGAITPRAEIARRSAHLLADAGVDFVDIRSARNNCFLARVRRADGGG